MLNSNKSFGIFFGLIFLFLSLYIFFQSKSFNFYYLFLAFLFLILGFLNAKILTPLNKAWIKFGELLGIIIGPIIMGFIYFLVIFPTSVILKLFGKDILGLKINQNSKSFWLQRKNKLNTMNNQF